MASFSVLEKKIDRHIKDNADQMKSFKNELQSLKKVTKPRSSDLTKTKDVGKIKKLEISCKAPGKSTNLAKNTIAASMPSINVNSLRKSASFTV
jgi:hypothetical protein